jgi:hypothetical protein
MLDVCNNGKITASEFALWVHPYHHMDPQQEQELRDKNAFLLFNINKRCNAEINRQELHEYCEYFMPEEVDFMVEDFKIKQKTEHYRRASSSISLLNLQEQEEAAASLGPSLATSRTHSNATSPPPQISLIRGLSTQTEEDLPKHKTTLNVAKHKHSASSSDASSSQLDPVTQAAIDKARAEQKTNTAAAKSRGKRGSMQMGGAGLDSHADAEETLSPEDLVKIEAAYSTGIVK